VPSLPLDDENLPLFTVGQVSIMLEVQQAFLRRLDDFGVVTPSRSGGGQRRYTRREITVVQYVVRLAGEGVSLAGIRRILELEAQVRDLERRCIVLQAQLRQIREQAGRAALEPASGHEASRLEASGPEASGSA
jgi:MerR family transcriptional regulator, heat shock protein HspR